MRELVGYGRYDTPEEVGWLNEVYTVFDLYANAFLPTRKLTDKTREGGKVRKRYDEAVAPIERLTLAGALNESQLAIVQKRQREPNPLAMHHRIEQLIGQGPPTASVAEATDASQRVRSSSREPMPALT